MKHLASSWRFSQLVGTVPTLVKFVLYTNKQTKGVAKRQHREFILVNRKNPKDFCK